MKPRRINKKAKAKKRVQELKGFYTHLTIYLLINMMLTITKIIGTFYYGETFMGPLWHFSTFSTWLLWGFGLSFHAVKVFKRNTLFSAKWEDRQIQKYMEEDRKEAEKYH